jgi:hypothetical protein
VDIVLLYYVAGTQLHIALGILPYMTVADGVNGSDLRAILIGQRQWQYAAVTGSGTDHDTIVIANSVAELLVLMIPNGVSLVFGISTRGSQ